MHGLQIGQTSHQIPCLMQLTTAWEKQQTNLGPVVHRACMWAVSESWEGQYRQTEEVRL